MARYEHLPIYKKAMDLTIYFEKIVRNFSRYHKYTLGTELRAKSREIVGLIIKANSTVERYKSERKWINTVYHELGHYVFWADAESKADNFAFRMVRGLNHHQ